LEADFGFTGFYRHQASGLNLTFFRAYDPELGRWTSRDPIAEEGGLNLYAYASGDPVNGVDPLGLKINWSPGSDRQMMESTIKFLSNSSTFRAAWDQLVKSESTYTMATDTPMTQWGTPNYDMPLGEYFDNSKTIVWDPYAGKEFRDGNMIPALTLAHEIMHAVDDDCHRLKEKQQKLLDNKKGPNYVPNELELSAVLFASQVAHELGVFSKPEYLGPNYLAKMYFRSPF
jgi:RHS repeat-associated protein